MPKWVRRVGATLRVTLFVLLTMAPHLFSGEDVSRIDPRSGGTQEFAGSITAAKESPQVGKIRHNGVLERSLSTTATRDIKSRYLLYLPWHYGEDSAKWPLLVYLHGGMGRGNDFEKMAWYPIPKMMLGNDSIPFVVIAPQCPTGEMWTDAEMLIRLIEGVCDSLAIDTNKVYLAGYSMGGAGVWCVAYEYPKKFAAIAPMSGWSTKFYADRLKQLPVWVFHGVNDSLVPVRESEEMIRALRELNAEVKASLVPGRGHVPPSVEEHRELFDWLLMHRRSAVDTAHSR